MTNTTNTDALRDSIRAAGGIVHSDGNIFFTNAKWFMAAARAALAAPGAPSDPSITLDFKMATMLLEMFGGEPGLVTLQPGGERSHSGPGLYAFYSDLPEEGAGFLGADPDNEAVPAKTAESYTQRVIEALYENGDPVSVEAAEEIKRLCAASRPPAEADAGVTAAPAQAGEYPELPMNTAMHAIDGVTACWPDSEMRAYADATCAARGAVQAAPAEAIATSVCRIVAELDRDSPQHWPEAMLVTGAELHMIVREAVIDAQAAPVASDALLDVVAHLAGAASAYRTYAKRAPHLGKVPADALFTTRVADMDKAVERGRVALGVPGAAPVDAAGDAILAHLDGLKDDAAAHIYPIDLERCATSECTATVFSVRVGCPDGESVPLFSREQVVEAIDEARAAQEGK